MGITLDPRKVPLDVQVKFFIYNGRGGLRALEGLLDPSQHDPLRRSAVCVAAYDLGFRDFAIAHRPLIDRVEQPVQDKLVATARSVCETGAELDLVALLSTVPLRNGGVHYPREQPLLRINFADGRVAYAKSRNIHQEAVGIQLLEVVGLRSYAHRVVDDWVVLRGVEGRGLGDHSMMPGKDTTEVLSNREKLVRNILAIVAFDSIFGTLDRNENGIVIMPNAETTAIDHEYLLMYPNIPMQGKDLLIFLHHLKEIGITAEFDGYMESAAEVFRLAKERFGRIEEVLRAYMALNPCVDMTFAYRPLDSGIIDNAQRIIDGGVGRFVERLRHEVEEARRIMTFP